MNRRTLFETMVWGGLSMATGNAAGQAGIPNAERRRAELYGLLGDLPPRDRRIGVTPAGVEERPTYTLERLVLDVNGLEPAPAYFIKPKNISGRVPGVLFNHWHGGEYYLGKDEMLRPKRDLPCWADALAGLGYCVLCMDMWGFGARSTRTEADLFKEMLWKGQVLWGMMVYDSLRGVDYLVSRPEVDPSRLATIGMSMGSTMAWWVAALDPRIKVCVDICCLTDFQALIEANGLRGHGFYYFVPSLLKHFTTSEINALIAPRPHLGLAGNLDSLTPPKGLDRIDRELKQVYGSLGKSENWKMLRYEVAHVEIPEMRREILAFFGEKL